MQPHTQTRGHGMSCIATFYATNHVFPTTTSFGSGYVFLMSFSLLGVVQKWQMKLLLVQQLFKVAYADAGDE